MFHRRLTPGGLDLALAMLTHPADAIAPWVRTFDHHDVDGGSRSAEKEGGGIWENAYLKWSRRRLPMEGGGSGKRLLFKTAPRLLPLFFFICSVARKEMRLIQRE